MKEDLTELKNIEEDLAEMKNLLGSRQPSAVSLTRQAYVSTKLIDFLRGRNVVHSM